MSDDATVSCPFCGKTEDEVRKLIAGGADEPKRATVHICDECIELCNDIIFAPDELS